MNLIRIAVPCIVAALLVHNGPFDTNLLIAFQQVQSTPDNDVEVLTRGPVHEAFAETVTFDPEPGLVAPKAPPADIEESPPEARPEGANMSWIPGYWAWDDERTDFLWVSGIWRALPPGREWVPGYWGRTDQWAQWTSGYWADSQQSEVEYLPEPPATIEIGPNIPSPSIDQNWLPGCWLWQQNRYVWRPGYWATGQTDWFWVPAHYVWTPRGYVFVDGYYDYSVVRRGVLYAPVYFNSRVYSQRGFSYSPRMVINPQAFLSHLFLRPSYGHYYFGDYYASNYSSNGYSPSYLFNSSQRGYDPFYAQERWLNRNDLAWEQRIKTEFQHRIENENSRPPRTWVAQNARIASAGKPIEKNLLVAASLDELVKNKQNPMKFQTLDKAERQQLALHEQTVRQFREQRQKLEVEAADKSSDTPILTQKTTRAKVKLPPFPIKVPPADKTGKDLVPPKRHEAPLPDPKVEPTTRKAKSNTPPKQNGPDVKPPKSETKGKSKGK